MTLFDITRAGAFVNAMDAAAQSGHRSTHREIGRGADGSVSRPRNNRAASRSLRKATGAAVELWAAAARRLAFWQHS